MPEGKRTRTRGRLIGLVIVLAIGTAIGGAQFGWWRYLAIASHQGTAVGTVLRTRCSNNNDVSYSFSVSGATQEGRDSWEGCRSLKPGDTIPVSFSLTDPTQNMAGDGHTRFITETISLVIASILGAIVVAVVFVYPLHKQRS
jgi:hypothetical protein